MCGSKKRKTLVRTPFKVYQHQGLCMGGKNSRRNTDVATACVVAEMAGRPRAKQAIVTAQEIMAPAIISQPRDGVSAPCSPNSQTPRPVCSGLRDAGWSTTTCNAPSVVSRRLLLRGPIAWTECSGNAAGAVSVSPSGMAPFLKGATWQYRRYCWWCTAGVATCRNT